MVTSLDVLKVSPAGQARGIYGNVVFTYNFIFWFEMLWKQWEEFYQRRQNEVPKKRNSLGKQIIQSECSVGCSWDAFSSLRDLFNTVTILSTDFHQVWVQMKPVTVPCGSPQDGINYSGFFYMMSWIHHWHVRICNQIYKTLWCYTAFFLVVVSFDSSIIPGR